MRDKGGLHIRLCLSQKKETVVGAFSGSMSELAGTSVCRQCEQRRDDEPHLPQHFPTLGQRSRCRQRGRQTEREQGQLGLKPQGVSSSSLGSDPTPDWTLIATQQRESPASNWAPALTPPSLVSWLQSLSIVILEPKKIKSITASTFSPLICYGAMVLGLGF